MTFKMNPGAGDEIAKLVGQGMEKTARQAVVGMSCPHGDAIVIESQTRISNDPNGFTVNGHCEEGTSEGWSAVKRALAKAGIKWNN